MTPSDRAHPRTLVIVPTYNELESLPGAVRRVREAAPWVDVLVADDNSPDGTGQLADELAAADVQVQVLHRPGKEGLGRAYVAGFGYALERGYELIVEMDADGSHRAVDLPALLERAEASDAPDLVIGSRWVPGGEVANWPRSRELISRTGNTYVRLVLGMSVGDATAGFRVFRASTLRALPLDEVESAGYCFQVDMTWRVHRAGMRIVEVPIVFVEREEGVSKMTGGIVREALWRTTAWGARHRAQQVRRLVGRLRRR
ncbi:polyprenol monophosphomannose synthase [Georgenia sp. Z1344]|uniref:polyprenol monophosphomannose synthase n=1 Tax=Georgenia sp. Z1344 TaxID=3416706 RepID=UPI003CF8CD0A